MDNDERFFRVRYTRYDRPGEVITLRGYTRHRSVVADRLEIISTRPSTEDAWIESRASQPWTPVTDRASGPMPEGDGRVCHESAPTDEPTDVTPGEGSSGDAT